MANELNRYSVVVLVLFALSIYFVIAPVSIPVRLPWTRKDDQRASRTFRIHIGTLTAPLIAVLILWASTCIDSTVVRDGIVGVEGIKPYNILILFSASLLQSAAFWVSNKGGSSGRKLYLYFYLMLTAFSIVVGNDPVILSGTVFLVYWTQATQVDNIAWLYAEFAAANTASMVLFVGNPTNVVICEGFGIRNIAYTAYTIFPFLACSIVGYAALSIQFRSSRYIPRKMPDIARLNPRSVLVDPVGAVVGSIILGSCLVVLLGVSFTDIEVWEITLPFAVAKFVWDLTWDFYRFKQRGKKGDRTQTDPDVLMKAQMAHMHRTATGLSRISNDGNRPTDAEKGVQAGPNALHDTTLHREKPSSSAEREHETREQNDAPPPPPVASGTPPERLSDTTLSEHRTRWTWFRERWPTITTAFPRLPFGLVPFAFLQFILVEALAFRGWIKVFARWLNIASGNQPYPVLLIIGVLGIVLCNISGTNIGATILLTKVIKAANMGRSATMAGAIALAISSNIGAVSFVFSASLAGLLWRAILKQKGIVMKQSTFAKWNGLPILFMTVAGLGVGCAELAVIMHAGLAGTREG
ncbi:hypothetical protein BKA62DRAFT_716684 [Auriculariales sp. MPI-PUGE-AT-0066]|nr:hypothetical protein BKA62DRAFT_716684 [Auriculariales sp. MPI-PUGE-AT-0066]